MEDSGGLRMQVLHTVLLSGSRKQLNATREVIGEELNWRVAIGRSALLAGVVWGLKTLGLTVVPVLVFTKRGSLAE